jgi:outer membrane protein
MAVVALGLGVVPAPVGADPPPGPLTLEAAVLTAMERQPAVRTATLAESVADARVGSLRTEVWPDLRASGQLGRATGNVVPGATFPLPGLPAVSGPPTGRAFDGGTWITTLGVSASWNVTDLTRRMTLIDAALAERRQSGDATAARRLQAGFEAADAYLSVASAEASARAARAGVERARVTVTVARTLVGQSLRPAFDLARAESELASATTQVIRAEQAAEVGRARLAEAMGVAGSRPELADEHLLDAAPAPASVASRPSPSHPLLREADAATRVLELRRRAVSLEYLPRVDLVAALWLRGGGAFGGGPDLGAAQGLLPDTPNWALGVVVSWPILETFAVRARARVVEAQTGLQRARRAEIEQALTGQIDAARALLDGARRVADNTAPALTAARSAERQAAARYGAGLGTLVEVADAQRMLTLAEVEEAAARVEVRRAELLLARAIGDLSPFLADTGAR